MASVTPINLVIADDHPTILIGLTALFESDPEINLLGAAHDAHAAIQAVKQFTPDILLLDLAMPEGGGLSVLKQLHAEGIACKTILYSSEIDDTSLLQAMQWGVQGVVVKTMPPNLLLQAIHKVYEGGQWLEMVGISRLLKRGVEQQNLQESLTIREIELIKVVAKGLRNQAIANLLHIQEGTVRIHLHNIYRKLNLSGRGALIAYARDHGLV